MGLLSVRLVFGVTLSLTLVSASNMETRKIYTIHPPKINQERKALEIIDLATFVLTNSEDGRPKTMVPFYLNIFETRGELSDNSIKNIEDATSEFLLAELNSVMKWNVVSTVDTQIVKQERFVKEIDDERKLTERKKAVEFLRGRKLRQVPGSKLEVNMNVTFDREPSPEAYDVDNSLQAIMKDLAFLVDNITATEDPELGYVFMAYREEISTVSETPTIVEEILRPVEEPEVENSMFIVPILVAFVFLGAVVAFLAIRRRRRRVQAATQKAQEDLAFLDEETNVFSFENSPTKSSARRRALHLDNADYDADNDSSSRYSTSQGSISYISPTYGMIAGMGSPTATRSSLSGASTVKVSNARMMPLPSKLTELASTSLFAFSEEDEDYETTSTEGGSSHNRMTPSLQEAGSNASSAFNQIMNGKSQEVVVSSTNSPRHEVTSRRESPAGVESSSTGIRGPSKSTFASFFSSSIFSLAGDSASHFSGSTLTDQAANTTDAVRKKAAKLNVRSFSLSPRHRKSDSPISSPRDARAKSDNGGGDDDSVDSVFDFVATSPKRKTQEGTADLTEMPSTPTDVSSGTMSPRRRVADGLSPSGSAAGTLAIAMSATKATTPTMLNTSASASPKPEAADTSVIGPGEPVALTSTSTSNNTSDAAASAIGSTKTAIDSSFFSSKEQYKNAAFEALRNLKKVVMTPHSPTQANTLSYNLKPRSQAQSENDELEEDSISEGNAPGSFPVRHRRHAKSTTHDGTFAYQTNAMQPQEWSMADGYSDDDTLSEHGGGAAFGAFPKTGLTPKSAQKRLEHLSPSNQSKSSYSQATQNSPGSKADSSQASASRQLINDLVWLSKKIAGVKQSAVDSTPPETSALGPSTIESADSLSYASQDGLISPTSVPGTSVTAESKQSAAERTPTQPSAPINTSIVCRDCHAPAGKLNIVIHSTKDGPAVHEVKSGSCLEGRIYPGDLIIAVNDIDTRAFTAAQLMKMMAEKSQQERKITVLHVESTENSITKTTQA